MSGRLPRKHRRAATRAQHWALLRRAATTPQQRAELAWAQMRAAIGRPEVSDRARARAWADAAAALDRVTTSLGGPLSPSGTSQPEVHTRTSQPPAGA